MVLTNKEAMQEALAQEATESLGRCCSASAEAVKAVIRTHGRRCATALRKERAVYAAAFLKIVGRKATEEEITRMVGE